MTDEQIMAAWNGMPGGYPGFCKEWGYLDFAHKLLGTAEKPRPDLAPIKAELRWCLENAAGPRTESALRWALEVLEDIEAEVKT